MLYIYIYIYIGRLCDPYTLLAPSGDRRGEPLRGSLNQPLRVIVEASRYAAR